MSFQNRCVIPTANGLTNLTVPIVGGRDTRLPLADVRIDHSQPWQLRHWRTITSAYNRSPFFEYYAPGLERIYQARTTYLHEWNRLLLDWLLVQFKRDPFVENILTPADHVKVELPLPKNFQESRFTNGLPEYQQVFMERWGFSPNMSSLDLLFCLGPQAGALLNEA